MVVVAVCVLLLLLSCSWDANDIIIIGSFIDYLKSKLNSSTCLWKLWSLWAGLSTALSHTHVHTEWYYSLIYQRPECAGRWRAFSLTLSCVWGGNHIENNWDWFETALIDAFSLSWSSCTLSFSPFFSFLFFSCFRLVDVVMSFWFYFLRQVKEIWVAGSEREKERASKIKNFLFLKHWRKLQ